jgi:hypothetical protein
LISFLVADPTHRRTYAARRAGVALHPERRTNQAASDVADPRLLIILTLNAERFMTGDGPILLLLSVVLIPIALAIAIVRYQLFDIRVVLSRALLYGLTIALVIAIYIGVVAGLTLLVPPNAQRSVSVAAAIVVAFLFAPLRSLVQRMINRAFYGTRSDPARTASRIGEGATSGRRFTRCARANAERLAVALDLVAR